MVTEMTSLQGIIGGEYALRSWRTARGGTGDWRAISNRPANQRLVLRLHWQTDSTHWLVSSPRDWLPQARKIPFGLRRAAIGVVQPLIEHDLDFDLAKAVKESAKTPADRSQ